MAKFYYGGQAVIEGVMMRGQRHMAVAVRAPDGSITLHEEALNAALYRHPLMKLPVLRGLVALWDALGLGMRALMFSADVALQEGTPAEDVEQSALGAAATTALPVAPALDAGYALPASIAPAVGGGDEPGSHANPAPQKAFSGPAAWTSITLALGLMVSIFFVLPVLAAGLFGGLTNIKSSLANNIVEGVIRLALFLGYIWAIGRMRDIERVFGYHGAEHKTINAYEAGVELTPENVQRFTLLNPRCGTTFLLIVMLLATVVFVLIGKLPFLLTVLSRIVLVPLIAAIAYEFIRAMANLYHYRVVRAILAPGIALQKMTTRPPDLSMIEVGIAALKVVLVADGLLLPSQVEEATEPETALA